MNLDEIREALLESMDKQQEADIAAANENYKLGQQKIMYANDARGSLYSGTPTWQRAQLAASNVANIADIQQKALKQKLSVWDNITNTLDKINSYNKAASSMAKASGTTGTTDQATKNSFLELYNELNGGS